MSADRKLRACALPMCRGERFDLVHKFPMDKERAETWLRMINLAELNDLPLDQLRKKYFVCSKHFRKIDYKNCESRSLNQTAYPRLFLDDEIATANYNAQPEPQNTDVSSTSVEEKLHLLPDDEPQTQSVCVLNSTMMTPIEYVEDASDTATATAIGNVSPSPSSHPIKMTISMAPTQSPSIPCIITRKRVSANVLNQHLGAKLIKSNQLVASGVDPLESEQNQMFDEFLTIDRPSLAKPLRFAYIWLRDHCRCSECYNPLNNERKFNILDIPLDVRPLSHESKEDILTIRWSDGHESAYSIDELIATQVNAHKDPVKSQLWNSKSIQSASYARVTLNDYLCDDTVAAYVVESLVRFGFAFIEKVPANIQSTEVAVKRLFPVQKTFFGEMWSLADTPLYNDTAYTNVALPPHTDNTYFNDAAGLQILHCVNHTGDGGNTVLVDGFGAAENLRKKDPNAYAYLCSTSIPAEYIDEGRHHKNVAPILRLNPLNGQLQQIRFNIHDRAPLIHIDQNDVKQFYQSYQALARETFATTNQWHFKLEPGTVVIMDNWRVLHGRSAYTGKRTMVGCYVARTDFCSVARTMNFIK